MKTMVRVVAIGLLHATVYGWLIPVVILPEFGTVGKIVTVICVVAVSVVGIGWSFRKRKRRIDSET